MNLKLDHAAVAGSSLPQLRDALASIGIPSDFGGPHANGATEMALTSFPDGTYLELIAIQPDADPRAVDAHSWCKFLKNDAGPCAFAAQVEDTPLEVARLKLAGIPVSDPIRGGRTRPDGVRIEWEVADIAVGPWGTFFPFLISDLTERELRVYPAGGPTTDRFRGLSKVVIGVHDLDTAIAQYRRAYSWHAPRVQKDAAFGAMLAWFERTPVILAQGLPGSWLTQRVRRFGDAPCAFTLALASGGLGSGLAASSWFGHHVAWNDVGQLGWRLGFETGSPGAL